ncbi:MAG: cupredoxin domain-containing protein [Thaumarchaeota archaeon]|nr:cupredoxin domain-containing protein [Nitrososphaerota archaeon]
MGSRMTAVSGRLSSIESRVSVAGCLYCLAFFVYLIAKFSGTPGSYFIIAVIPFMAVFALAAVGIWLKPKAGYITALAVSGFTLFFAGPTFGIGDEPTLEGLLAGGGTLNAILFLILFFSLIGARGAWRKASTSEVRTFKLGRLAGIGAITFLLLFVALGVSLGLGSQTPVSEAGQANVVIEPGSAYITNPGYYSPSILHVTAGQTVVWKNLDNTAHTVTGDNGLESGSISPGGTYSFTFTQPGTYVYSCDYHTWMVGSIVVGSG